jgi:hypothetical protein
MHIGFYVKYPYSCPIIIKLEFSKQILEKYLNIKFHLKNRPVGAELFHANGRAGGLTEGRTDVTKLSHFSQYCKSA